MPDFLRCKDCKHDIGKCLGVSRRGSHKNCFEPKVMTNADRIRAMSDEELARFIDSETDNCAPHGDCKKVCDDCKACWFDWLQQPAEEG